MLLSVDGTTSLSNTSMEKVAMPRWEGRQVKKQRSGLACPWLFIRRSNGQDQLLLGKGNRGGDRRRRCGGNAELRCLVRGFSVWTVGRASWLAAGTLRCLFLTFKFAYTLGNVLLTAVPHNVQLRRGSVFLYRKDYKVHTFCFLPFLGPSVSEMQE